LDTLALGALLALMARSPRGLLPLAKWAPWTLAASLLLLAPLLVVKWTKVGLVGALGESAKLSVICLCCGSLLLVTVTSGPRQLFGWFFSLPVMRFFGKYSYGIYVFHELFAPLFNGRLGAEAISRNWGVGNWYAAMSIHFVLAFVISVLVALISWNLLEKHMLKLKRYFEHEPAPRPTSKVPQTESTSPVAIVTTSGRLAG
jgi:peptidoglycan/LPS O-acetylase OafA/YrhL